MEATKIEYLEKKLFLESNKALKFLEKEPASDAAKKLIEIIRKKTKKIPSEVRMFANSNSPTPEMIQKCLEYFGCKDMEDFKRKFKGEKQLWK